MHEPNAQACQIEVDPLSGRAVFVAPERARRPLEKELAACPFCAGNEHLTPHEVARIPADATLAWEARLIPNRYPVVVDRSGGRADCTAEKRVRESRPAHGVHDVIVESPRHDTSILTIEPRSWRASWELVRQRLARLSQRDDLAWGMVFKNSGTAAGASLDHVHSQLVALDFVPPPVAAKLAAPAGGEGAFDRIIDAAEHDRRIVAESADLVALVPPAPRQPLETWLIPRSPGRWFHAVEPEVVVGLADLLREVVARIERVAPGTQFNWWLHQAPFERVGGEPRGAVPAGWRWHVEIMPRISPLAGFELGTGCHITIMAPAESARRLRGD